MDFSEAGIKTFAFCGRFSVRFVVDSRSILRGFFSSFFSPFVVGNRWTAMVHNGDVLMKPAIGDSILSGKLAKDMGHNSYGELARANNLLGMRK
jgi:hypothetical protein